MVMDEKTKEQVSQIEGYIFDLDGTLIDSERVIVEEVHKILPGYGIGPEEMDAYTQTMRGLNHAEGQIVFQRFFDGRVDYQTYQELIVDRVKKRMDEGGLHLLPGARAMVNFAKDHGKIALATSTPEALAKRKLQAVGLEEKFDFCVFGDHVRQSKPDPQIFFIAASGLKLPPEKLLIFEDSNNGARAGLAGGFPTFFIEDLSKPQPEVLEKIQGYFSSLEEALIFLEDVLD